VHNSDINKGWMYTEEVASHGVLVVLVPPPQMVKINHPPTIFFRDNDGVSM
jgi:hypothetical protein